MDKSSSKGINTKQEEEKKEGLIRYWKEHYLTNQLTNTQKIFPNTGRGLKDPSRVNDVLDRAEKLLAKYKKNQEEIIRANGSNFSGRRVSQRPIKCGVDKAHPLKPIHKKEPARSCSTVFGSCSNSMESTRPVAPAGRRNVKGCTKIPKPREEQACSSFDYDFMVNLQDEQMEAHLHQEAHKVAEWVKDLKRNTSSARSDDKRPVSSDGSLSPVDLHTPLELHALPALRSPFPEPPSEPVKTRRNENRLRRLHTVTQPGKNAAKVTDKQPSVQQPSGQEKQSKERLLKREEPLAKPELSLMQAFNLLRAEDWEKIEQGLVCVRALAEHHSDVLMPRLHDIKLLVTQQVKNLRSVVARAAIATLGHMYVHLKKAMNKDLEKTACVLLLKAGESNSFLREDVELALGHMVQYCSPGRVLSALRATGLSHRNAPVRRCTALNLQKLAELLGAARILNSKTDLTRCFLVTVSQLALDSAQDVRFHARNVLRLLSTHKNCVKMVEKFVPQRDKASVKDIVTKLRYCGPPDLFNHHGPPSGSFSGLLQPLT